MRKAVLAIFILLAACGQPSAPATESESASAPVAATPEEEQLLQAIGSSPQVLRTYDLTTFVANGSGVVEQADASVTVTTDPRSGAFSAVLPLGEEALQQRPMALRATVEVSQGTLQLVMTHRDPAADFHPYWRPIPTGAPVVVYLPLDQTGAPLLIIANGAEEGISSGRISGVELVGAAQ